MTLSPNRVIGIVLGAGYLALGVLGFFAGEDGLLLGVLLVDPLGNAVHLAFAAALLVPALLGVAAARRANAIVGAACLLLGLAGLFLVGGEANVLALNVPGNVLHFASAVLLLAVGLGAEQAGGPSRPPAASG